MDSVPDAEPLDLFLKRSSKWSIAYQHELRSLVLGHNSWRRSN